VRAELLWVLPAGFALLDWYAVAREDRRTETWAKPATLLTLIVVSVSLGAADSGPGRWLLVALAFGLLGDVFLLGRTTGRFQAGLAAFLVGHLAYLGCFVALGLGRPGWALAGVAVAGAAMFQARGVLPATHRSDGPVLSVPVGVYMLVITAMVVAAWATGDWLVALGASVFVGSDTLLAINRFVRPLPRADVAVMVAYHLGQALIVLGVLGS
jgi:uncharacterized membrane protein YhhN